MTAKSMAQHLEALEKRWQELQEWAGACPEAREALASAFGALSQAIAALQAAQEAGLTPPEEIPGLQVVQTGAGPGWPPEASAARCETILSNIFDAIPDLITVIDRDHNIVMSNWHRPEVPEEWRRGQPKCYRAYHRRDRPCEDCHVQRVFATGQPVKVEKTDEIDGRVLEFSAFPILDESGQVVLVAEHVREIQERYLAEKALRESEELYHSLFENMLNGFAYCKMIFDQNQPRDFIYLDVNSSFEALTGLQNVIGKKVSEVLPGVRESDPELLEIYARVALTGKPERFETYLEALQMWLSMSVYSPAKEYFVAVFDVITDRKRAEEALKESEERFKFLFEYAPDAYFLMDLQGKFIDVNRSVEELIGYGREEIIGESYRSLPLFDDQQQLLVAALLQQAVQGEMLGPVELCLKRKDGGIVIIEAKGLPLQIKGDNLILGIARDITARKQAEEALRESEERFKTLFEFAPDAYYLMDLQGNFIAYNRGAEELSGYSREEIIGKNYQTLPLFDDQEQLLVAALLQQAVQGEMLGPVELCLHRKEGGTVIIEAKGLPLHIKGDNLILGVARDITARKQAEEALRESEQRFRDITAHAAEWVWEVDPQGKYTYSSPVVEQLLGYKPEEVLGQYFYDFFIPEEREKLKRAALVAFTAKQPFKDFLNPNLHKNGQIVWLSTSGIPILDQQGNLQGYRGADINITARREAEEFSHNLIAKSPFGIYVLQNRKLQQVNRLFFAITGYREDELANLEPIELIHPEDREATRENVIKMLKGLSSVPYEYRTITKGGETKWIMETVTSIQYHGKRAVLGYFMDITERRQLENQLLQAQKMEAVGRLAGGVAHDFNNLLMAITGYGELMRAKVLKDDPLYDHLENMLKASERAAGLTRQLLTFSRQQIAHSQVIDLNRVVLDMEQMLRRLIGEDIDLEIIAEPGPAAVKADPGYLGQIIMNLVVNARDAMPLGGRLTLKTASVEVKGRRPARFGPVPPGAYVMLVVQDTGVGMDEAIQAHIFEPFFTTKGPGKGTGLGLSTVYGIVNQSGGYIAVDSEPGAGSTFTIYLPRLTAITAPPQAKIPPTALFRGEETILLVEDEDVLRNLLAKFLRLYGYTVLEARHGGEALLLCERHQGPIQLMVTDVVMPQMSGRELAERLGPLRPDMKVVYMSGYADDSKVQYGVADLAVPFLQKPFKPIELARKVHAVLHPPAQA